MTNPLDVDHPYYASEGSYCQRDMHNEVESWADFLSEYGSMDEDYNMLYRWDWRKPDPSDYEDEDELPVVKLELYYILQRKALTMSVHVAVTDEDVPAITEYLKQRADHLRRVWAPIL